MPDIIQQLLDLKEWSQDSARYERRLNFRGAGLVQPGPGRQGYAERPKIGKTELKRLRLAGITIPEIAKKFGVSVGTINTRLTDYDLVGTYKRVKPMSNRKIAEIKKTLPDGVRFQWVPWGKSGEQGSWKLMANIDKRNKTVFSKSSRNPDLSQIKQLVQDYENAYKKYYPNSLSNTEFEKLRFSNTVSKKFKTKYKNLTAKQFAEVLNGLGYKTAQDLDFNVGRVHDIQRKLDIFGEVGREVKPLTKGQQNTLINAFPEYADQWDFKANKYGLQYSEVGKPVWTMLRHTADDTKRWPTGNTAKSRLWHGAYRSALKGGDKGRFKILHPVDGEIMSRDEILKYNWTKGSSDIKFVDTLTDEVFDYKGFEKWMNNHAVPGKVDPNRFKNAEAQYDLTKKLKQINIGDETFGSLLDKKFKGKGSGNLRFSGFHNHHLYDIADNFWDTDVVFFKDNLGIAKFEKGARQALRDAAKLPEAEQTKFLKSFANKFKDMGPIRLVEGEMTLGSYGREDMLKNVAKQTNLNKTQTKEFLKLVDKKIPYSPRKYSAAAVAEELFNHPLARKAGSLARKIGVEFEAAFVVLDFINNLGKGIEPGESLQRAFQTASLDIYKGGERKTIENILKAAEEAGFDPKVMRSLIEVNKSQGKINDFNTKINNNLQAIEDLKERDVSNLFIQRQIKAFEDLNKRMESNLDKEIEVGTNLFGTYVTNAKRSKGSFQLSNADITKSFIELQTAATNKLKKERIKSAKRKSTQVDVEAGPIGDVIQNALGGLYTYPKYAFDVINPLSPLPKWGGWKTEGMKEKERIIDMQKKGGPGELYRYNIARGYDIDQPLTGQAYETMIKEQPYLGIGEFSKGGISSLLKKK